jgi:pyridoxine/pyridoxamine 5'-phosphate oxidase
MDKQGILDFIRKQSLCVLSTVNVTGESESSAVGFSENEDFEIVFGTSSKNRKFQNILQHPKVSVVIGWDDWVTVQYEGSARVLAGGELARYQKNHFMKLPSAEKYSAHPDEMYVALKPHWLRYTDCNQEPWLVTELNF